jgi:hypothetical protein
MLLTTNLILMPLIYTAYISEIVHNLMRLEADIFCGLFNRAVIIVEYIFEE